MTMLPPGIDHKLGGRQHLNPYPHVTENKSLRSLSLHLLTPVPMPCAWLDTNPECISYRGCLWT